MNSVVVTTLGVLGGMALCLAIANQVRLVGRLCTSIALPVFHTATKPPISTPAPHCHCANATSADPSSTHPQLIMTPSPINPPHQVWEALHHPGRDWYLLRYNAGLELAPGIAGFLVQVRA